MQIMWPGLFRVLAGQSRSSSPQLKQDADYVTQGKPASVATKARVGRNWSAYRG